MTIDNTILIEALNYSPSAIYITDWKTDELLYVNNTAQQYLNLNGEKDWQGRKCYEVMFGKEISCAFCNKEEMHQKEFKERILEDKKTNRSYLLKGRLMEYNGELAHIEYILDITLQREKELNLKAEREKMQKQYTDELQFQEELQGNNLIVKLRANLTKNEVELYKAEDLFNIYHTGMDYVEGIEALSSTGLTMEQRRNILNMMNRECVQKEYEKGNTNFSIEYQRKAQDGSVVWVNTLVKTYQDVVTGDLMSFMYTYDINQSYLLKLIVDKVAQFEYEFMGIMDIASGQFTSVKYGDFERKLPATVAGSYEEGSRRFIETYVAVESQKEALQMLSMTSIQKHLEESEVYNCSFSMKAGDKLYRKKWQYAYVDENHTTLLFVRSDITDIFEQQEKQRENLRDALAQAEVANNAKSNFLSRMSHEIRTPMNAIIGMSAIAAQNVNNPEQVSECISKVGLSARFLLNLINDILDMSRIESGKMTVKWEKFPFEELLNGINGIIYEQAAKKGLDYDYIVTSFTDTYYIGDAMKIQQVLINLLGNAIKFTPVGGKVQLLIHEKKEANGKTHMVFTVNDTGVGMTEEFQKIMFDPFEQENNSTMSPYGGTGLGLAICKNLVAMMGGTISVNSIEGIGSEFTVELTLERCEEEKTVCKPSVLDNFSQLYTLIVDDDVIICEHTKQVLLSMGMRAEWVDGGKKAVDLVRDKWNRQKAFDVILLDWKMPDMDGIETARQIREIVGPEVTIIIMTAYDWSDLEIDAKAAGVNLLVSKPLFKSSILSAFEKIYEEKEEGQEKNTNPKDIEYDFAGKCVLLVEDHILNIEVARRLLESKGIIVDIAENGLAAIESFTTAPEGRYDLILMDIRMPMMDGLTAARSIRHLKKKYAGTVPIVAMSANAFDEDVEKSKAAGMNAHLAKPIEPYLLYATLNSFWVK